VQLRNLPVDHGALCVTLVENLQVLHDVDRASTEDVLGSGVERLGEDEVCVGAYADDQRVGGEDGLDEVHLAPNVVMCGDEGDILIASVVNETGQRLIGLRTMTWRGWVCVGVEEGVADVALVQQGAISGAEMQRVVRSSRWF
jgi:hypothetical protein